MLYIANVVTWKSTDGGRTFVGWRGAPGGDDYHRIWINPENPAIILIAADQGAIVTVNGGRTWSSWYNQPTAQFYHVSTDNAFPYRVCGGTAGERLGLRRPAGGTTGQVTFREWHPVGAEEYGYIAPDPLHPDIVYGGKVSRYDRSTGQVQDVSPEALGSGRYRFVRTMPLLFSPVDPHVLYLGANVVFRTVDGGATWTAISPDLTRRAIRTPAGARRVYPAGSGEGTAPGRGVYHRAVVPDRAGPVGGDRRWTHLDHARWWRALAECDTPGTDPLEQGVADGGLPLRHPGGVRRG